MDEMTSNVPSNKPEPTLDEMLDAAEQALRTPLPIGSMYGEVVTLNMWDRTLSWGKVTCSVDHPFLDGTKIRDAALQAMGDK